MSIGFVTLGQSQATCFLQFSVFVLSKYESWLDILFFSQKANKCIPHNVVVLL